MIVADEQIPLITELLGEHEEVVRVGGREIDNRVLIETGCTALFVRSTTNVNAQLLANTAVTFVASATSGIDHVDTHYLEQHNIRFVYAPGHNASAVVEYVQQAITQCGYDTHQTVGVVGVGNVGSLLVSQLLERGFNVVVCDPPRIHNGDRFHPSVHVADSITDVINKADVVTLHVPLTTTGEHKTHNLLRKDLLEQFSSNQLLINTSRGGVVDDDAWCAISPNSRPQLVLDVYQHEPSPSQQLVRACAIATPHIAGYTSAAKHAGALQVIEAYATLVGLKLGTQHEMVSDEKPNRLVSPFQTEWTDGFGAHEFDGYRAEYLRDN